MRLPHCLQQLRLPAIGAPLFIISNPRLVLAQCMAGMVGSFPALNARPAPLLDDWLAEISETLARHDAAHPEAPAAPYAVNLIVHGSNDRLEQDLATCAKYRPPLVITSLGARAEVNDAVHAWGGLVLHDVTHTAHARKAIERGADGLIAVSAGAGGHAGAIHPFALLQDIRSWFDGPLALSGAIATGRGILAAQVAGADFAYIGSAFIATEEANAAAEYKQMVVACDSADILCSDVFTGIPANYLRPSIVACGLDPADLSGERAKGPDFGSERKAWRNIWGAGQGIGAVDAIVPAAARIAQLQDEYRAAIAQVAGLATDR